jgi:hypothetical protein
MLFFVWGFWIQEDTGCWMLDAGCSTLDSRFWMLDAGFRDLNSGGFWIQDSRFRIKEESGL